MYSQYKYNPEDFSAIMGLSEDMSNFYKSLEIYQNDKNDDNWLEFRRNWEDLFFALKHRVIEKSLNPTTAQEIREYIEELLVNN